MLGLCGPTSWRQWRLGTRGAAHESGAQPHVLPTPAHAGTTVTLSLRDRDHGGAHRNPPGWYQHVIGECADRSNRNRPPQPAMRLARLRRTVLPCARSIASESRADGLYLPATGALESHLGAGRAFVRLRTSSCCQRRCRYGHLRRDAGPCHLRTGAGRAFGLRAALGALGARWDRRSSRRSSSRRRQTPTQIAVTRPSPCCWCLRCYRSTNSSSPSGSIRGRTTAECPSGTSGSKPPAYSVRMHPPTRALQERE